MNDRSHLMCCKVDCGAFLIDNGVLLVDYRALLMDDGERWGAGVEYHFQKKFMSPTPRRKWYLTTGRRAH